MGNYNPNIHHRRSIRLKGYDYSQAGLYFVTIVCQNRKHLFGKIENNEMILNDAGKIVDAEWLKLPDRFKNIKLHEYTVMPNHFHAILEIVSQNKKTTINNNSAGATLVVVPTLVVAPHNNQKGQPQGIAPTESPIGQQGIAPTKSQIGQQGIAPTESPIGQQGIAPTEPPIGQQGIAPTESPIGQQGIAPTEPPIGQQGIAPTEPPIGQQGIAPTNTPTNPGAKKKPTLGDIVGAFESITTVKYIDGVKTKNWKRFDGKLWQRNYWEHIIRNEKSYNRISKYIKNNPANWNNDKFKK